MNTRQKIHMKNQALFSSKDKSKKLKCHLLQFLFGALRINPNSVGTLSLHKEWRIRGFTPSSYEAHLVLLHQFQNSLVRFPIFQGCHGQGKISGK